MPRLLIVHHTPSPHTQEMFEAVVAGATDPEIEGVEVVRRPALTVSPVEMLEADGYLFGTQPIWGTSAVPSSTRSTAPTTSFSTPPVGDRLASTSTATRAPREPSGVSTRSRPGSAGCRLPNVVVMGKPTKADVEACWNLADGRGSVMGSAAFCDTEVDVLMASLGDD